MAKILDHVRAIDGIFCHRQKLDGAPAFAQRFLFSAKTRIHQADTQSAGP